MSAPRSSVEVVCATRRSPRGFAGAPLGRSLAALSSDSRLSAHVAYRNRRGLPAIYNDRIRHATADVVVFIHDDVWIDDPAPVDGLLRGLSTFDVIGVAGNRRTAPHHVSWAFINKRFTWDRHTHLSGAVAHGRRPHGVITQYGETPAECELLDGVLLAARRRTLARHSAFFDPAFDFHFYDLDFCRTALRQGLRLGTWPIAITHASGGSFGSPVWERGYRRYRQKWAAAQ